MADEYISREAAIKAILDKEDREIKNDYGFCVGLIVASNAVSDIPAADVAPRCPHFIRNIHDRGDDSLCEKWGCEVKEVQPVRHGRWEPYSVKDGLYMCSECNCIPRDKSRYCPNCGCRMDGGGE